MKVIDFKVPQTSREAFRLQHDLLPYFYDKLHHHNEWQLMHIENGAGTLIAGDYVGRFESSDIFLVASNQPHVFRCDDSYYEHLSKSKCESLSIYFDEAYLGTHFWELEEMALTKNWFTKARSGFRILGKTRSEIATKIKDAVNQSGTQRLITFFEIIKCLTESGETENLSATIPLEAYRNKEGNRINDILQFTFKESHRKIYLDEVAQVAHLSVEAFCRYFKISTGKTYTSFLNEVRVSNACKLLIANEMSVQDVCFDSGFSNLSNFNRIFKKVTGKKPSQYLSSTRLKHA